MSDCKNRGHIYEVNTCFSLHQDQKNWFEARHDCENRGNVAYTLSIILHVIIVFGNIFQLTQFCKMIKNL